MSRENLEQISEWYIDIVSAKNSDEGVWKLMSILKAERARIREKLPKKVDYKPLRYPDDVTSAAAKNEVLDAVHKILE